MPRPLHAVIHPQALKANLARVRLAAGDARVWAVVKANAYGHGVARVFEGLRAADGFAVLDLAEAQILRGLEGNLFCPVVLPVPIPPLIVALMDL